MAIIITLLLRHLASRLRVPLKHQLHSIGMLPTMVRMLITIKSSSAIAIGFKIMGIAPDSNKLEPVMAHLSLLEDCLHQRNIILL
jgi:hypothetical protein